MFKFTYDPEAKAAYIYYDRNWHSKKIKKVAKTVEADKDCVNLDYDKDGNLIGVELLNLE